MYKATLSLCQIGDVKGSGFKVSVINNNQWTGENISYYYRPRGYESMPVDFAFSGTGRVNIDVTQTVCEARALGIKSLTFRIVGKDKEISFYGKGDAGNYSKGDVGSEPRLYINATDDKNVVCATEAAIKAIGSNSPEFVTMDLTDSYTSSDGTKAKIRWLEYNSYGKDITGRHLSRKGEITRPKWFEEDAHIVAYAKIKSDEYSTERRYNLIIPAETAPDYRKHTFGNYIDIGDSQSESEQKFESINVSGIRHRWTGGHMFSYRTLQSGGAMVFNFICAEDGENYLTLKLWEGKNFRYQNFKLSLCGGDVDSMILKSPAKTLESDGGFVYITYALPREFTKGRNYISLRIEPREEDDDLIEPRGMYSAYLTQTPLFEPRQFADQGERTKSEPSFSDSALTKFKENLSLISDLFNLEEDSDTNIAESNDISTNFDTENCTAVVASDELNIAFSVERNDDRAVVYQKMNYYDRYCSGCPVVYEGDIVMADYGSYKMIWNRSLTEEGYIPYTKTEFSGAYKDVLGGEYYKFSNDGQMSDADVIPEGKIALDGRSVTIPPKGAMLLMHMSDPSQSSDWRISRINGVNVTDVRVANGEKIDSITIKAIGGTADDAEEITAVVAVYENEKMVSAYQEKLKVLGGVDVYDIDFSKANLYMDSRKSIRIFVTDAKADMTELTPKFELPQ